MPEQRDEDAHHGAPGRDGSSRGWKIAAGVSVLLAAVAMGVLGSLLFFGGAEPRDDVRACIVEPAARDFTKEGREKAKHERPKDCPPEGAEQMDGLVEETTDGGFTIRRIEDGVPSETVVLHVRRPDRAYIDIAHAQTHAALGQPVRVYTLEIDGRRSVVYMEDAPLLD